MRRACRHLKPGWTRIDGEIVRLLDIDLETAEPETPEEPRSLVHRTPMPVRRLP